MSLVIREGSTAPIAPDSLKEIVNAAYLSKLKPDDITRVFPAGNAYSGHGIALEMGVTDNSYKAVEIHLCETLRISSRQNNNQPNDGVYDAFCSSLNYLELLQLGFRIKPGKIERLKIALMRTLIEIDKNLAQTIAAKDQALTDTYIVAETQMLQNAHFPQS